VADAYTAIGLTGEPGGREIPPSVPVPSPEYTPSGQPSPEGSTALPKGMFVGMTSEQVKPPRRRGTVPIPSQPRPLRMPEPRRRSRPGPEGILVERPAAVPEETVERVGLGSTPVSTTIALPQMDRSLLDFGGSPGLDTEATSLTSSRSSESVPGTAVLQAVKVIGETSSPSDLEGIADEAGISERDTLVELNRFTKARVLEQVGSGEDAVWIERGRV